MKVQIFLMLVLLMFCGIFAYYYFTSPQLQLALATAEVVDARSQLDTSDLIEFLVSVVIAVITLIQIAVAKLKKRY